DLTDLREAPDGTLAEGDAVRGVAGVLQHGVGEAVGPAVGLGVVVEVAQLAGCDVLAHLGARVVHLGDVGGVVAGERQPQGGGEVVVGHGVALDGDVRVALHEGGVELLHLLVLPAAHLLVPHDEGDVAELGDVGADLLGGLAAGGRRLVRAVPAAAAGGAGGERQQRDRGGDDGPADPWSAHDRSPWSSGGGAAVGVWFIS